MPAVTPIPGVSDNSLILTTWGTAVQLELNTNTVKNNFANQAMTGPLAITGNPPLKLRRSGDQPFILFETTAVTPVPLASVGRETTGLVYNTLAGSHRFLINSVEVAELLAGGHLEVPGDLRAVGAVECGSIAVAAGGDIELGLGAGMIKAGVIRGFSATGGQFQIVDRDGGRQASIHIYGDATTLDNLGTRSGIIGYLNDNVLQLHNEINGGDIRLTTDGAGDIILNAGSDVTVSPTGNLALVAGGNLSAAADNAVLSTAGVLLLGKTVSGLGTQGIELHGDDGQIWGTVTTNIPNVTLNRTGTADVDNALFVRFTNNSSQVGSISWDTGTSHVLFNQTSDYRLKTIVGPVVDGLARIRQLKPYRIVRKDSTAPVEHDALIAHEVADVMPEVVTGVKDAVAPAPPAGEPPENYPTEGSIVPQQLDYLGLTTVTIAAIKDLADQVDALTARVAELEGV